MSTKPVKKKAPEKKPDAKSKANAQKVEAPAITLSEIVKAGSVGMYVPEALAQELWAKGWIEVNAALKNEKGDVACRATFAGAEAVEAMESAMENPVAVVLASPEVAPKVKSVFSIEAGIPVPPPIGRGRSGSKYPFDELQIGESFFVADSSEHPDATASLASTVSGATQRFATDHPTETKTVRGVVVPKKVYSRKFSLRRVEGGARVWRVAVSGVAE